jgi:hypothetical protein
VPGAIAMINVALLAVGRRADLDRPLVMAEGIPRPSQP